MDVWYGKKYDKTSTHFHNTYVYLVWLRIAKKRVFSSKAKVGGKKWKKKGGKKPIQIYLDFSFSIYKKIR